ncbi:MAG: hypothetical protein JOZ62_17140 [Acidobacteriaceae bacterium]|nr:hypothetical protein [Acidobacteriaceae bacterium]
MLEWRNTKQILLALTVFMAVSMPAGAQAALQPPPGPVPGIETLKGKKLLFIITLKGPNRGIDDSIRKHLESLGMSVSIGDGDNPPTPEGYDAIAVSDSVKAKTVSYAYKTTTIPIITWKPWLLQFLGMTGMQPFVDFAEETKEEQSFLLLVNAPHPMQAGFPNGLMTPVKHAIKQYNWGKPGPGATIIATLPGEFNKAVIFGYEKGVLMDHDFVAPARRSMFFMAQDQFDTLSDQGVRLFDAAFAWTLGQPARCN